MQQVNDAELHGDAVAMVSEAAESSIAEKSKEVAEESKPDISEQVAAPVSEGSESTDLRSDIAAGESSSIAGAAMAQDSNLELASEAAKEAVRAVEKIIEEDVLQEEERPILPADESSIEAAEGSFKSVRESEPSIAGLRESEDIRQEAQRTAISREDTISTLEDESAREPEASTSRSQDVEEEDAVSSSAVEEAEKSLDRPKRRRRRDRRPRRLRFLANKEAADAARSSSSRAEQLDDREGALIEDGRAGETIQPETSTSDATNIQVRLHCLALDKGLYASQSILCECRVLISLSCLITEASASWSKYLSCLSPIPTGSTVYFSAAVCSDAQRQEFDKMLLNLQGVLEIPSWQDLLSSPALEANAWNSRRDKEEDPDIHVHLERQDNKRSTKAYRICCAAGMRFEKQMLQFQSSICIWDPLNSAESISSALIFGDTQCPSPWIAITSPSLDKILLSPYHIEDYMCSYILAELKAKHWKSWKAAGVLPYTFIDGNLRVLLAHSRRQIGRRREGLTLLGKFSP